MQLTRYQLALLLLMHLLTQTSKTAAESTKSIFFCAKFRKLKLGTYINFNQTERYL